MAMTEGKPSMNMMSKKRNLKNNLTGAASSLVLKSARGSQKKKKKSKSSCCLGDDMDRLSQFFKGDQAPLEEVVAGSDNGLDELLSILEHLNSAALCIQHAKQIVLNQHFAKLVLLMYVSEPDIRECTCDLLYRLTALVGLESVIQIIEHYGGGIKVWELATQDPEYSVRESAADLFSCIKDNIELSYGQVQKESSMSELQLPIAYYLGQVQNELKKVLFCDCTGIAVVESKTCRKLISSPYLTFSESEAFLDEGNVDHHGISYCSFPADYMNIMVEESRKHFSHFLPSRRECGFPPSILILGLGGGLLPTALHHTYPDILMDIVEVNPVMVEAAKYFGFDMSGNSTMANSRIKINMADAEDFVTRASNQTASYFLDKETESNDIITDENVKEGAQVNNNVLLLGNNAPGVGYYDLVLVDLYSKGKLPDFVNTSDFLGKLSSLATNSSAAAVRIIINCGHANTTENAQQKKNTLGCGSSKESFADFHSPGSSWCRLLISLKNKNTISSPQQYHVQDISETKAGENLVLMYTSRSSNCTVHPSTL